MISVVIPTYNRGKTIIQSVKSVLNQSYKNIEVIIVDDNSTDNTETILKQLNDKRIRYIKHKQNKGACAARNTGIKVSQGEYIAFHDSDDIWHKDKLEKQIRVIKEKEADVVFCAFTRFNYRKDNEKVFPNMESGFKSNKEIVMGFYISTQTILGKRDVFYKYQFDETMPRMQDYDLMIRVSQTQKVYFLNESLVNVYLQSDSISAKDNWYKKTEEISYKLLNKYPSIAESYPEWKKEILSRIGHCKVMQGKDCCMIYKEIWELDKSLFSLCKYILCKLRIIKYFFILNN